MITYIKISFTAPISWSIQEKLLRHETDKSDSAPVLARNTLMLKSIEVLREIRSYIESKGFRFFTC
jgi:hypothetical protein